ncbi:MAG TPA: hypothetical protein VKA32_01730 [Gammaproteobacteria bacterium]|nr:hypothetical protein [Gammaproteobacteria bacterium]
MTELDEKYQRIHEAHEAAIGELLRLTEGDQDRVSIVVNNIQDLMNPALAMASRGLWLSLAHVFRKGYLTVEEYNQIAEHRELGIFLIKSLSPDGSVTAFRRLLENRAVKAMQVVDALHAYSG